MSSLVMDALFRGDDAVNTMQQKGQPMLTCAICGKPSELHLTEIHDGVKTETHYCMDHVPEQFSSLKLGLKVAKLKSAMEDFRAFVKREQRMPTMEELKSLGFIGSILIDDENNPFFQVQLDHLRKMAEMLLDEGNTEGEAPD